MKLEIDTKKCQRCNICFNSCPVKAIEESKGHLKINHKKCIECHCCYELCTYKAVKFKQSLLRKILQKIKNLVQKTLSKFTS